MAEMPFRTLWPSLGAYRFDPDPYLLVEFNCLIVVPHAIGGPLGILKLETN
jgi:hypothetical protein